METEPLLRRLQEFRIALAQRGSANDATTWARRNREVQQLLAPVLRIAERFDSSLVEPLRNNRASTYERHAADAVDQLIGIITYGAEIDALLGPTGPQLAAGNLHPWVWESAARLWAGEHRREAIQAAATHLDHQLQAKLNRSDVSGSDLATQAFTSAFPEPGKPRLRLPNLTPGTDSWKSAHDGAMHFARGCFMAIRNPATHTLDQPDEQTALELLAALSVLARWIDQAEVQTS